jgi:putrescine---pyruvate transaminase
MATTRLTLSDDEIERLTALDRAHFFHAATPLQQHAKDGPRIFVGGEGIYLYDAKGRAFIDGLASLWNVNCGHGRQDIVDAITGQMRQLAFSTSFFGFAHPAGIELAARLARVTPPGLDRFFFVDSGSAANETAIKLARSYHKARGHARKVKVISRARAYHGATYGTLSATRLRQYHEHVSPLMEGFLEAPAPYRYRCEMCSTASACTEACADAIDALIRREGPDTVAMVIGEPVQAAGGIVVPPDSYWPRLREICRAHDVLLVADEVICGFGRTGRWFGVDNWAVVPDMLTIGKGLTSGYMPLSGVAVSDGIYDVLTTRPDEFTFWQGFTYNAHPGCCAAALQTIEILDKENLVEHAQRMGRRLLDRLRPLESSPIVGEVRGLGLLTGVEIVADRKTRAPFPDGRGSATVRRHCLENGLIVRAISDTIAMSPPLVISETEVDHVADVVSSAVRKAEAELGRR